MPDLSQEAAASVAVAREIDGSLFIACRDMPEGGENPVSSLTPKQYEVLLLAAQAMTHQSIAEATDTSMKTVRTHLSDIYGKLDVHDKPEAASFIPMDEHRLRSVPLTRPRNASGRVKRILSTAETETFKLLGAGYSNKAIASTRESSVSTIRTYRKVIADKLSIKSGSENKDIELRRVAGAMRNLSKYVETVADTAATLQPNIEEALAKLEKYEERGKLDLSATVILTVSDQALLARLAKNGYITKAAKKHGRLNLVGVVAALLIKHPENQALMEAELTRPVAREIIKREVGYYKKAQTPIN